MAGGENSMYCFIMNSVCGASESLPDRAEFFGLGMFTVSSSKRGRASPKSLFMYLYLLSVTRCTSFVRSDSSMQKLFRFKTAI